MSRILFRVNAALYKGNTKGPKVSRNSTRDNAGWLGDNRVIGPVVVISVVSEILRVRV